MKTSMTRAALLAMLAWTFLPEAPALAGLLGNDEPLPELTESAVTLPAAPAKDKLLRYYVSPTTTMDFAVDAQSVSISDRVIVRFTSVITSPSGAANVSHEGIRCDTLEKKLYATGRADGRWTPAANDAWRAIGNVGANRYHAVLARDYFCDGVTAAGKAEALVERLRRQKPLPRPGELR
jgi:hypothetical protein